MTSRTLPSLGLALLLLPVLGCDKATPVAPAGVVLTISASPSQVALNGTSTITVIGRKPDGQPLNPGTEVRFSTNIGSVNPLIANVGSGGIATTIFSGDGRSGTATITASTGSASGGGSGGSGGSGGTGGSGGSTTPPPTDTGPRSGIQTVSISIVVGQDPSNRPSLLISANPSTTAVGATSAITVIARNPDRSPVPAGQSVLLTTTLGTLNPSRPTTRSDGTATSILSVGVQAGTATIGAILGSSDQVTTTVTIRDAATDMTLQSSQPTVPRAGTPSGSPITLSAFVVNGQGQALQGAPVTFNTSAGTLETLGVVASDSSGVARNKLTLTTTDLPLTVTKVTITATTPNGVGVLIIRTLELPVQ